MILTVCDDEFRYKIQCPDSYDVKLDHHGTDYLLAPDPDDPQGTPYWLFDEILIEAARQGDFDLRLLDESPLG